ncbi:DUF2911 domain-containing protein [Gaetbulibacter saemankumensis]|uniref:DUF2911 domain-containing protein n=1 Tax=Gaetbulibacter saemankumensis TaxID=311208 RepID=UPI0003FC730A|nr:DUF2911 domain-containing protein [Gaetbulibacter saemankumensis]
MKTIISSILILVLSFVGSAQVETPQPSPSSKLEQKVGLTDVTIEYSRPSMRGRTIFGDLVPYGKLWRFGANKNTVISFSEDVVIDGYDVKAGSYAIFAIPNAESWEIIFYSDTQNWGTPANWDDAKVAARVTAKTHDIPFDVETFTLDINNLSNDGATIDVIWEKTYLGVPFEVPTDKAVTASINKIMNGPGANDYFSAAVYYLQAGKDINQAKEWIDKAITMAGDKAPFWQLRQQSLIYAKAGDKQGAIAAAKKSLSAAEKAGNADYVKMNKDSLKEWGAI